MNQMIKYLVNINKKVTYTYRYPSDYFAVNLTIMKIATIWYPDQNSSAPSRNYIAFSAFCFLFCIIFCTPSEFISFWYTQTDMNALTMNVGVALTHLVASIKVINWYVRRKKIINLMAILDGSSYRYEKYDEFIPGYIVEKAKYTNINVSTVFFWCSIMVPISGYVFGFINFAFNTENFYTNVTKNGNESVLVFECTCLPFYSWIPFNHSTEITCIVAMLFQSFPMLYLTLMIVGVDTLFMSLVNYLTAHVRILQGAFRTFRERAEQKLVQIFNIQDADNEILNDFMMIEMKKCLKHLQTIQQICKTIEDVYSLQMLCQVLVSLFVLCTCLFLVSTEPMTSKTFLVEVIYIIAIEYQLTLYCWFGNELTLASAGIVEALYNSDWLVANGAIRRCMIITMIRMKTPLYVTVGKFTPLTLITLQTIVRGSYSMYAVLKNRDTS